MKDISVGQSESIGRKNGGMTFAERLIYFALFLLNKYVGSLTTEGWLSTFERKIIRQCISGSEILPTPIPTVRAVHLTDAAFLRLSDNYRRPVLIRGLMRDSLAVKKWDIRYLRDVIGGFKINTVRFGSMFKLETMAFREFIDRIEENRYINNNHTILANFPHLFEDFRREFEGFMNTLRSCNLINIHIANLFIGYNGSEKRCTGSNMHCGGSGNFFFMIRGRKHWTLIDPKYSCILKGRVARSGIHGQTLFDMPDTPISDTPRMLRCLPRYEFILEPGDVLYNPPWWWHRIRNDNGFSIGMAIRNNKVTRLNLLNNLTYTLSGYTYLKYNSLVIGLYERTLGQGDHFGASRQKSRTEGAKQGDVLYQAEQMVKRYPTSVRIDDILGNER